MNRREWIGGAASLVALSVAARAQEMGSTLPRGAQHVKIAVDPSQATGTIPETFMGLGYEVSSVPIAGLFDPKNTVLIQLLHTLGRRGVIRIGGNTSDYDSYAASGKAVSAPKASVVNTQSVKSLGEFINALGWELIWSLNLGSGKDDDVVAEAQAVAASTGDALLALQVGNEPDLFVPAHRAKGYGYEQWLEQFRHTVGLVRAKVPNAPFAGPDIANNTEWFSRFAKDEAAHVKLLTAHFYAEGPPQSPTTTIEDLLGRTDKQQKLVTALEPIAKAAGLPYRICEVNSCYGGGKPGVSDTFASALWALDYMFALAEGNATGVNMETGVNHLGVVSAYTPIAQDVDGHYYARPIYYGMLAFTQAARGERLTITKDPGSLNMTAYATKRTDGHVAAVLINKDLHTPAEVTLTISGSAAGARAGKVLRLTGPSIESKTGVLLGGAAVAADGTWKPAQRSEIDGSHGAYEVMVPAGSAAIVNLGTAV